MNRRFLSNRDAFPQSAEGHAQQLVRHLQHRRAGLDMAWAKLEEGWKETNERMITLGVRPRTAEEGMVKLNVGGSIVNARWHLLAETKGFEDSILGALLEGVWGEGRVPRDADGRIVLDESPACIKHIVHAMLSGRATSVAVGMPESAALSAVAVDEVPCFIYTAHVMGLPRSVPAHGRYLKMNNSSTVLEPFEVAPLGAKIREWVGSSTEQMTLIYRGTRDGFDARSIDPTCSEDRPYTVSLVRVSSGQGDDDSIVGGYSVLPWGRGNRSKQTITAETFVFMLKDGGATRESPSKPTKWSVYLNCVGQVFTVKRKGGACIGGKDLCTSLDATTGGCTLLTGRELFTVEEDSPFLALRGKKVVDMEVYRSSTLGPSTTTAPSTPKLDGDVLTDAEAHDIRSFGESIANSLMDERMVLDRAVEEMEVAGARVSAAVGALETVYGPSVAAGEQDAVVELNVRGVRMTTLRSTLQACPCSALAAMFDEERWPATDKDKDEHGGRLIDCDPTCFSKLLDVLRIRKRAWWSQGVKGERQQEDSSVALPGGILIKEADAEAFGAAVNMYFPGCENFIMGLVQGV